MKFPWSRKQPVPAETEAPPPLAAEPPPRACSHPSFVVHDWDRVGWCTCTSCGARLALADALNGLRDRLVAAIDRANRRGRRR